MIESEYIKKTDAMNIVKRTHGDSAFFQCLSAGSLLPSGCNVFALQCLAAGAAQRIAVRLSYGLPSQAVRF